MLAQGADDGAQPPAQQPQQPQQVSGSMDDGFSGEMAGDIAAPPSANSTSLTTLDEPVSATLLRDVRRVGIKLKYVLIPRQGSQDETLRELKNWDLWGPLILCLFLSVLMSISAPKGQASLIFAAVFVIVWCGAAIVTINAQLLGGTVSFFQSVCVLGYCIFPLVVACMVCLLWSNIIFRLIIVGASLVWATQASVVFMSQLVPAERKSLAVFPVILFYLFIGWMILVQ